MSDDPIIAFKPFMLSQLERWISERDAIRSRRSNGMPKPWTTDPVLRDNRFCNVRRMDDKVSTWLLNNWYSQGHNDTNLLVAATLARHINWPDTLAYVGYPVRWNSNHIAARLHKWKAAGHKVFTGAYIINGGGQKGCDKIELVVQRCEDVYLQAAAILAASRRAPGAPRSMAGLHAQLVNINGIGSFMAGQIVADLRYTSVLAAAPDAMSWAPRGPGSTRGMNRLLGDRPLHASFTDMAWQRHMLAVWARMTSSVYPCASSVLRAHQCELMDMQNCLCEFDKYMRVSLQEGRARSRYPGF